MPRPESLPGSPPVEVVTKKTGGKERFATIPTHIRGVSVRTEPDSQLPDLKQIVEGIYPVAREHARRYFQVKDLQSQQGESDKELKTSAQTHDGLRGVQSKEDDFLLTVFPRASVTLDRELLKRSLGIAYSSLVHEDLDVTISVPAGLKTEEGLNGEEFLHQVLTQALIKLGLEESDLPKIMETNVNLRVDNKSLEEMVKAGKVSLLPGTRQTETTWAITVDRLNKSPKN